MFLKRPKQKNLISKANKNEESEIQKCNFLCEDETQKDIKNVELSEEEKKDQIEEAEQPEVYSLNKRKQKLHGRTDMLTTKRNKQSQRMYKRTEDFLQDKTFKAKETNILDDQRATATFSVDTEVSMDNRAILERNEKIGEEILKGNLEEGTYRGLNAYKPIINKREGSIAASKYTGLYGPIRSSNANVRMTLRVDYEPDICKDYKETGYCGWGDTCKFLHDRSDYKSGWQIEREWKEKQKKQQEKLQKILKKNMKKKTTTPSCDDRSECGKSGEEAASSNSSGGKSEDEDSEEDEDGLPFACLICRRQWNEFSRPVMTQCIHYFCEDCAFKNYAKSPKCFQCGKETHGLFNTAHKIVDKIEKIISKNFASDANSAT